MTRRSLADSFKDVSELVNGLVQAGLGGRDLAILRRHPQLFDEWVVSIRKRYPFDWQPVGLPETLRTKQVWALLGAQVGKVSPDDVDYYIQAHNFGRLVRGLDDVHRTALYLRSGIHSGLPRSVQDIAASWLPFSAATIEDILRQAHAYLREAYDRNQALRTLVAETEPESLPELSIWDLNFSERTRNCLLRLRIETVAKLCEHTPEQLLADPVLEEPQLREVEGVLDVLGMTLRQAD